MNDELDVLHQLDPIGPEDAAQWFRTSASHELFLRVLEEFEGGEGSASKPHQAPRRWLLAVAMAAVAAVVVPTWWVTTRGPGTDPSESPGGGPTVTQQAIVTDRRVVVSPSSARLGDTIDLEGHGFDEYAGSTTAIYLIKREPHRTVGRLLATYVNDMGDFAMSFELGETLNPIAVAGEGEYVFGIGGVGPDHVVTGSSLAVLPSEEVSDFAGGRVANRGMTLDVPAGWFTTTESLTPNVSRPPQVMAFGTYELRPGAHDCAHLPTDALEDLGSSDILVVLTEDTAYRVGDLSPITVGDLDIGTHSNVDELSACLNRADAHRIRVFSLEFEAADRGFQLLGVLGADVSESRVSDVLDIVRTLRIEGT